MYELVHLYNMAGCLQMQCDSIQDTMFHKTAIAY